MDQKILTFKIFFILLLIYSNILNAKSIIGYPKIIDGDTIHINNKKIRLHGIDAPERNQMCSFEENEWPCGKQSTIELKKLINNQIIQCKIKDTDIYKRYIAVCLVNQINLNQIMVKKGWAIAYKYYSKDYINEENYASKKKVGIWKGEFEEPYLYRKRNK